MPQLVFLHGPGAGACADAFHYQLKRFPGSVAPTLPGHLLGASCQTVERYTEWVRGWLWAQGYTHDLLLVGYTLGACIALQYGLDYPDEVKGLVLMTVAMRSKQRSQEVLGMRLRAAEDPKAYQEWWAFQQRAMTFIDVELKAHLMERHRQVGPISQYNDLVTIDQFDVRDRIQTLQPKLILIRGVDDPGQPPEYESEIHEAVPGSRYIKLENAGHFPMAERPNDVNGIIEKFMKSLPS
ncbi:MAG: alpha/beta hydrolase [Chloroflexi bacterium]|nr:alpha/beta hydrolase [Chloroflexota bacterium]